MVYARRDRLPSHVKVNRAGAVSLLSVVRGLGLNDRVVFSVQIEDDKTITLIPTTLQEVPASEN